MSLRGWVDDQLHEVLGLSDKYVSQFLIELAQRSGSADQLLDRIRDTGTIDVDERVAAFARQLHGRVPRAAAAPPPQRAREAALAELYRKNQQYRLVSEDEEDDAPPAAAAPKTGRKRKHIRSVWRGYIGRGQFTIIRLE